MDGKYIDRLTETHSLTAELEPGTYFLWMDINDGRMEDMFYNGTCYTLSLTEDDGAKDISGCTVSGLGTKAWTGSAIKPTVTVKDGTKTLKSGTDYTVAYADNTNAGTATVTITGKGAYTGTIKKTYKTKDGANPK